MSDYKLAFNNETIIDRELPSELIRFIINDNFDSGICTYTTSIDSLRNYINIVYEFDDTIVEYKNSIFKLFVLYELAKELKYSVRTIENAITKNFNKLYLFNYPKNILYNVNDGASDDIVVKDELFKETNIVVEINEKCQENLQELNRVEKIYMQVENNDLKKYILNYSMDILLPKSKCRISVKIHK